MRVLQIGLGSMGKRRIRNLQHLGGHTIIGYDPREDRRAEAAKRYGIDTTASLCDDVWRNVTHVIVSTPPDIHHLYSAEAAKRGKHVFIEASILDTSYEQIQADSERTRSLVAPSCTMQFDPLIRKLKSIIDQGALGRPLFATHYFGQYLPNWHPYEKIRDFYVSKRATGAAREIVAFDLIFMTWLLGYPAKLAGLVSETKTLDADIDDIYSLLYSTESGTQVHMTIEVISRVSYRDTRIAFENGNIELDFVRGLLRVFSAATNSWQEFLRDRLCETTSREEMYVQEMKAFLDASAGGPAFPNNIMRDRQILHWLYKAEEGSKHGRFEHAAR